MYNSSERWKSPLLRYSKLKVIATSSISLQISLLKNAFAFTSLLIPLDMLLKRYDIVSNVCNSCSGCKYSEFCIGDVEDIISDSLNIPTDEIVIVKYK